MPTPLSFRNHGTYVYEVPDTINHYGSTQKAVAAMQAAGMTHAWVRIHNKNAPYSDPAKQIIGAFIDALRAQSIAVAGWGWCQGDDPDADADLAINESSSFGLSDYIADIEDGVHGANWEVDEIDTFCRKVRPKIAGGFGITTFPLIDWHKPQLMQAALPYVDMFNPQVYWHRYPDASMAGFKRPNGKPYGLNEPAEYAELCLDCWDKLLGATPKDLVLTGEAFWGEATPPMTQAEDEAKLDRFLATWTRFNRVVGLNWWHFGDGKSMSPHMLTAITNADLGTKAYKNPEPRPQLALVSL